MQKLSRPIVFFDLETTGTDVDHDQIVQMSLHRIEPGAIEAVIFNVYVMPSCEIKKSASEVNGITKELLKNVNAQPLSVHIPRIMEMIGDADLAGYNITQFDVPVLENELLRNGVEIDLSVKKILDVFITVGKVFSRSLTNMYELLTDETRPEDSHDANADVRDTRIVLSELMKGFPTIGSSVDEIIKYTTEGSTLVDYARKFYKEDGVYYFNFGTDRGNAVDTNPDFLQWMLDKDFPRNTKLWAKRLLDMMYEKPDKEKYIDDNNEETGINSLID